MFRIADGHSHDRAVRRQARAIAAGDPAKAAEARVDDSVAASKEVAQELTRRGVFDQRERLAEKDPR